MWSSSDPNHIAESQQIADFGTVGGVSKTQNSFRNRLPAQQPGDQGCSVFTRQMVRENINLAGLSQVRRVCVFVALADGLIPPSQIQPGWNSLRKRCDTMRLRCKWSRA